MIRRLLALGLALVLAVGAIVAVVTIRAFPQADGTVRIAGLDGEVEIIRDRNGIAHVYADTPHDLFVGQGYVHAQERLWQMEVWRHISAGRLSELFGAESLEVDRVVRTLGWRPAAQRDLDALSAETRAVLDAYAEGVNAFLDGHRGGLGLPFVVVGLTSGRGGALGGYDPEPWSALDSIAFQKLQAWNLGSNWSAELFAAVAATRVGDDRLADLFPPYPADRPVIVPGPTAAGPRADGTGRPTAAGSTGPTAIDVDGWLELARAARSIGALAGVRAGDALVGDAGVGSNEWAVAPGLSATGSALFANDPHLGISMPSIWFMNGLHCRTVSEACPYHVAGVSFPGVPAVVLGHNARIAWGATNVGADVQDLVTIEVDPADRFRYRDGDAFVSFELREERIEVAGGGSETLIVRTSRHGPVLNDVIPRLRNAPVAYALRWTTLQEVDRSAEAILGVNLASDVESFRSALSLYGTPAQNFLYADVEGHIGYQLAGSIPIRSPGDDPGTRPVPNDGAHEWLGRIPFDELPVRSDPRSGVIVTANNRPAADGYPYHFSAVFDPGDRAQRIRDLLDEAAIGDGVTLAEMTAIQNDTRLLRAGALVGPVTEATPGTADGATVRERIVGWDQRCDPASRGCAAFEAFEYRLLRDVFDPLLGDVARDYVGSTESRMALRALLARLDDAWWDDTATTERVETAPHRVAAALDATGELLRDALGDPGEWTWGRLHVAAFREVTLGRSVAPLRWYFGGGSVPAPGTAMTVNNAYMDWSVVYPDPFDEDFTPGGLLDAFAVSNLPSYRLVLDLGDLDGARIVTTTGQAGNPFDRHYGDLVEAWATGETIALPFSRPAVEAAAEATLTLEP